MKNETDYIRLTQKLGTLKEIIKTANSNVIMLINFSAHTELIIRNKKLSEKEIGSLEKNLDGLIEKHLKLSENISEG